MAEKMVTVAVYGNVAEAEFARSLLESEGIHGYLEGAASVTALWHVGTALGGIKLQVADADAARAAEILRPAPGDALAAEPGDEEDVEYPGDAQAARAWRAAVIGLFLCPPLLHFYSAWILLRLALSQKALGPSGTTKFYLALAVDVGIVLAAACLARGLVAT